MRFLRESRARFRYTDRDWRDQREKELLGTPLIDRIDRCGVGAAGTPISTACGDLPGVEAAAADFSTNDAQRGILDGYEILSWEESPLPGGNLGFKSFCGQGVFHFLHGAWPP